MINEILNHVKARLGASHRKLELDDSQLVKLLQTETLRTLSVYNPFYIEYSVDPMADRVDDSQNTYNLPLELEGFELIGVEKVFATQSSAAQYGATPYGVLGADIASVMTNYMNSKLMNGIAGLMLPPETFQYIHPGILRIFNTYTQTKFFAVLRTTHRKDFSTFAFGLRETIMKLALADVANDLLGIRQYFQNIGSTFAEINLNVDQLKEWADRRDDIIENLRKSQLKNTGVRKVYLA